MPTGSYDGDAFAALLFMEGGLYVMDVTSALNSSPWTIENFGGDPSKAVIARAYVMQAVIISNVYSAIAALVSHRVWPLVGSALNSTYLWWTYEQAIKRARGSGSINFTGGT